MNTNNNIMIAEFLGFQKTFNGWFNNEEINIGETDNTFDVLLFDTSWDWLMGVIQTILDLDEVTEDMEVFYLIRDNIPNLEDTYNSIISFIKKNQR